MRGTGEAPAHDDDDFRRWLDRHYKPLRGAGSTEWKAFRTPWSRDLLSQARSRKRRPDGQAREEQLGFRSRAAVVREEFACRCPRQGTGIRPRRDATDHLWTTGDRRRRCSVQPDGPPTVERGLPDPADRRLRCPQGRVRDQGLARSEGVPQTAERRSRSSSTTTPISTHFATSSSGTS